MTFLEKLEQKFHRFGIAHLPLIIIVGQMMLFLLNKAGLFPYSDATLVFSKVMNGEVWRLLTFLFIPFSTNILFLLFGWYLFHLMGTTLETEWGTFKFSLFILIGSFGTIIAAGISPKLALTNNYIYTTVFLAFARLYPNFQLHLMLLFPVRIRWLALFTWIGFAYSLLTSSIGLKISLAAALMNYALFFGKTVYRQMRSANYKMKRESERIKTAVDNKHKCSACGKTEVEEEDLEFRTCTKCSPPACFCINCLKTHTHKS